MRPVLLLVPDYDAPVRLPRDVALCPADTIDPGADYAAVIVLNDGRAGTVQRLREALALRERCHELEVGVLTWLDTHSVSTELKVELKERVLSVEYQA